MPENIIYDNANSTGHIPDQPEVKTELYDSGALRHMSPFIHCFSNYHSIPPHLIVAANKRTFYAIGTGDLRIDIPNGDSTNPIILCDTLHAPDMALTIVSIGCITSIGNTVTFKNKSCKIKNKSGKIISNIPSNSNGLYKVDHSHSAFAASTVEKVNMLTLH